LSRPSVIELERPRLREQQERKLGCTPHDALEIAATRIHIYTWVDERMKYGFSCREGLCDAFTTWVVLIKLVSVFLLEQRARNDLPFTEKGRLSYGWIVRRTWSQVWEIEGSDLQAVVPSVPVGKAARLEISLGRNESPSLRPVHLERICCAPLTN
jgi:hypothetical protein